MEQMIKEKVQERIGDCEVEIRKIVKNNGVELTGAIIHTKESNMAPTIYLENFGYPDNDIDKVVDKVVDKYYEYKPTENLDVEKLFSFENVKDKIIPCLVNGQKNVERLSEIPHLKFLDLEITFRILLEDMGATIPIKRSLFEYWNISEQELFMTAKENMKKPYKVQTGFFDDEFMTIIRNSEYFGATAMIDTNWWEENYNHNVIVIPSSVYEVIVVDTDEELELDGIEDMIRFVNTTNLLEDEILSDHAYMWNAERGEMICK